MRLLHVVLNAFRAIGVDCELPMVMMGGRQVKEPYLLPETSTVSVTVCPEFLAGPGPQTAALEFVLTALVRATTPTSTASERGRSLKMRSTRR